MLTYGIPGDVRGGIHIFILNRHTPSGQSRVYRVTQLRTDGVHCRESAGTGSVVLNAVPVTATAFAVHHGPTDVPLFSYTHYGYEVDMKVGSTRYWNYLEDY